MWARHPTGAPWLFFSIARQRSAKALGGKCVADRSQRVKNADATRGTCPTARTKRSTRGIMIVISLQSPFEKREAPPASSMLMKRRSRTRLGRWWPWMSPSHQLAVVQSPAESTLAMQASRIGNIRRWNDFGVMDPDSNEPPHKRFDQRKCESVFEPNTGSRNRDITSRASSGRATSARKRNSSRRHSNSSVDWRCLRPPGSSSCQGGTSF